MANTVSQWVDRALRRLPPDTDPGNVEQWFAGALQRLTRAAMVNLYRPELSVELGLTLGVADAYGVQSVAIGTAVLPESILVIDSVRHSDLVTAGALIQKPSLAHLLPPHIYSASVYGYYCVEAGNLYARRPSASLAITAAALKAMAVTLLTAVANIPIGLEALFEDLLVEIGGEIGQPNQPSEPDKMQAMPNA